MTTATGSPTREAILREIAEHELRIVELRAILPSAFKHFFEYRCWPERKVIVYAANREQADERLRARMEANYGNGNWKLASSVVKVFDDPNQAAGAAPDNLLRSLSEAEAREFLADFDADKAGRAEDIDREKHLPMSQLERDCENYRIRLRMKDSQ